MAEDINPKKKILVSGSSGFIGKHLIDVLLKQGNIVLGIDRSSSPREKAKNYFFKKCDILDKQKLIQIFVDFEPDMLIHLAARTDLDEKNNLQGYATNIEGVDNIIEAIKKTKSLKKAIFTSTQLVCEIGYIPKDEHDYQPNTLYGASKVAGEKIVREKDGGAVEWCIVRPTTVWGPGMSDHYKNFFKLICNGKYFHVGDKALYKSYGYVGNVVYQYLKILEAPDSQIHHKVFYLADYSPISLREWAEAFQKELGARRIKSCPVAIAMILAKIGDAINFIGFRNFPFNSFRINNILSEYQLDISNTEKICGPLPYTKDQGVKETVAWLRKEGIT